MNKLQAAIPAGWVDTQKHEAQLAQAPKMASVTFARPHRGFKVSAHTKSLSADSGPPRRPPRYEAGSIAFNVAKGGARAVVDVRVDTIRQTP